VYGAFHDLLPDDPNVFAYTRTLDGEGFVVVLNFATDPLTVELPGIVLGECVLHSELDGTSAAGGSSVTLGGWQAAIHRIAAAH